VEVVEGTAWVVEVSSQTLKRVMWRTAAAVELWPDLAMIFDGDLVKLKCKKLDAVVLQVARAEKNGWRFAALRCPYASHNTHGIRVALGGALPAPCPICADSGWLEAAHEMFGTVVEIACVVGRLRDIEFGVPTAQEVGLHASTISAMTGIASAIGAPAPAAVVPPPGTGTDHLVSGVFFSPGEKK
jgi:hypothetical protein